MNRNKLISYAIDFVSYLVSHIETINQIILFGSVARGDFDEKSDIDLFVDVSRKNIKKMEKNVKKLAEDYHKTQKAKSWQLKGIHNPFSCIVGSLEHKEWQDLRRGIANNALVLYGKYYTHANKTNHYTLFSFEKIHPESKRVLIHRLLFGFRSKDREYPGLSREYGFVKIGKGALLVPVEHSLKVKEIFHKKKVPVRVYDLWSDYTIR